MATERPEQLVVSVEARIRDLEKNMMKAGRIANDRFGQIERRGKQAGDRLESTMAQAAGRVGGVLKSFGAGFLGGIFAGGVLGVGSQIAKIAGDIALIGDEAKRAGLDIKSFQELKYVAEQNRLGVDSLVDGIKELNLRADEFIVTGGGSAAEAFQRLGYDAISLREKLRDPSALFTEIIGKMERLDRAARIRIADEIFGGTGGEKFVQLIDRGEQGIRDQIKAANDLGIVMDEKMIAKADELDRQFRALTTAVGAGLKQAIVDAALALQDFINAFHGLEAQRDSALDENLAALGKERLDVERQIIDLQDKQRRGEGAGDGIFGTSVGESTSGEALAGQQRRLEAIAAEEAAILKVMEARRKVAPPPTPSDAPLVKPPAPPKPAGGGSRTGSADSALRERQAVADLIDELEEELRLIGATDEERRAAEASRRASAAATDGERQKIIALNEAIYQEGEALERERDRMEGLADVAKDFASGLRQDIINGVPPLEALGNAIGRLSDKIFDELLTAIFEVKDANAGGGGFGGMFGWLFKLLGFRTGGEIDASRDAPRVLRRANGGPIFGPGGPKDDKVPVLASDGEYIVNADATRKNRALLEAINSGAVPRFADGGVVGNGVAPLASRMGGAGGGTYHFSAPISIKVEGGSRGPEYDKALGDQVTKQVQGAVDERIARFAADNSRPGGAFNQRKFT